MDFLSKFSSQPKESVRSGLENMPIRTNWKEKNKQVTSSGRNYRIGRFQQVGVEASKVWKISSQACNIG